MAAIVWRRATRSIPANGSPGGADERRTAPGGGVAGCDGGLSFGIVGGVGSDTRSE